MALADITDADASACINATKLPVSTAVDSPRRFSASDFLSCPQRQPSAAQRILEFKHRNRESLQVRTWRVVREKCRRSRRGMACMHALDIDDPQLSSMTRRTDDDEDDDGEAHYCTGFLAEDNRNGSNHTTGNMEGKAVASFGHCASTSRHPGARGGVDGLL